MPTTKRAEPDACSLLDTDHKNVKKMFTAYEELANSKAASAADKKRELANQICAELTVHTQIEEEIFYPAVREAIKETDLLDEAEVEHASAKDLIAQIQEATESRRHVRCQGEGAGRVHRPPREGRAQRDVPQGARRPRSTWSPCANSSWRARKS
jgi:hemerythrin superfamily protein